MALSAAASFSAFLAASRSFLFAASRFFFFSAAAKAARSCLASALLPLRSSSAALSSASRSFAALACCATVIGAEETGPFHAPPVMRFASAYARRFFACAFLRPRNPSPVFWVW